MTTDNALVQALPASYFFMVSSWLGSIYVAYTDLLQLNSMYLQHNSREKFVKMLARTTGRKQVSKARRLSLERTDSINPLQINGKAVDPKNKQSIRDLKDDFESRIAEMGAEDKMYDMLLELELSARELTRKQGDVLTIMTESIPITAIQIYALKVATDTPIITIVTLVVATLILGAKVSGLGSYKESRIRRDKAEEAFRKHFGIEVCDGNHHMVVTRDTLDKLASGELAFVHGMKSFDGPDGTPNTARSVLPKFAHLNQQPQPQQSMPQQQQQFQPQQQQQFQSQQMQPTYNVGQQAPVQAQPWGPQGPSIQMGGLQRVPSIGGGIGPAMV